MTDLDWDLIYQNPLTTYSWNLTTPIDVDLGAEAGIAVIDGLSIGVKGDPFIDFGFSARSANGPTHFSFSSELLVIDPALAIGADASGWANVIPGVGDTVVSGDFGGKAYRAEYNGGTVFADLVSTPVVVFGQEVVGSTIMTETISSMQVHWGVTVSGGGQASGNSHFQMTGDVVPEPASVLLLGLGGLALIRKRRA